MEIIKVNTKRGLELRGAMFGNGSMQTVVIMVTGICSNVFQNDLLASTGKLLSENGIAFIAAHTHDAFSCFAYTDHSIGKQRHSGVYNADFTKVFEDVESYVEFARHLGFQNIVLGGHSLGSNKIIHYLANTPDDYIKYFIISSPVDLMHWWNVMPNINICFEKAKKLVSENRGNELLPYLFGGFSPMSANTVLGLYNADNLKNCPIISSKGETDSLYAIKPHGTFIIGSKDSITGKNPKVFMEKLNSYTRAPKMNKIVQILGASHIFYGQQETFAKTVLDSVQEGLGQIELKL